MDTVKVYHYVYKITNITNGMFYFGKRSSKNLPEKDLGINYFSSSTNKSFIADQKINKANYQYVVVGTFLSSKDALEYEITIHEIYDVGANPMAYNRAKATSNGFDTTGTEFSQTHREKLSQSHKGVKRGPHTEDHKAKLSQAKKGRKLSERHLVRLREVKEASAKRANIYEYSTNKLIASNVSINEWCRKNGYNRCHVCRTASTDRSQPSTRKNNHHHKGIYAEYL